MLGQIIGSDIGPDGSLFLIDYTTTQILRLSPTGTLTWRVGRKGGGPGEYQLPYRVVATGDGCLVYDLGTGRLTKLDSSGAFVSQNELSMRMLEVDNIVALAGGGLAISGVGQPRTTGDSAVHIFDGDFTYVRSFGSLPPATSLQLRQQWGAGGLSRSEDGSLVFTRRLPYEIWRFTPGGQLLGPPVLPFAWKHRAADVIKISTDGTRTVTTMDPELPQPGRAVKVGSHGYLSTHTEGKLVFIDLLDQGGKLVKSARMPLGWRGIVGFDAPRNVLWMTGEVESEPVLFRLDLSSGSEKRTRTGVSQ